jgi:hypothetical protein
MYKRTLLLCLTGAALVGCQGDGRSGQAMVGECSPRSWSFDSASGARIEGQDLQPNSSPAAESLTVGPAPSAGGQGGNSALAAKVSLTREAYFFRVVLPACSPSDSNSLLDKRLTARVYVDGPAFPAGAEFTTLVLPHVDGPAVTPGQWTQISGKFEPPTPEVSREHYRQATDLQFAFTYTGTEAWTGTVWLDDVIVSN